MALPTPTFILGLLLLGYLSTFVVFAILRILTGISIQRIGLSSLRRIAFTPRDGLTIEIRALGLQIHRPTYAQPTWISVVISELKITADLEKLDASSRPARVASAGQDAQTTEKSATSPPRTKKTRTRANSAQSWDRLTNVKNRLKRLHTIIPWLKLLDLVAAKSQIVVKDIGTLYLGTFLLSVDTRRHALDRSRLFLHARTKMEEQTPAEWSITARSLLFDPPGKDSIEIMDHCVVNIHGFLSQNVEGLRDAAVFVKLGRLHIPYDEIVRSTEKAKLRTSTDKTSSSSQSVQDAKSGAAATCPQSPVDSDRTDEQTTAALAEAKEFVASVLRGIREVSFAVSLLGISKSIESVQPGGKPVCCNMSVKELGLDVFRLEKNTPAQSMYFAKGDVAHQALLSAISLSVGIDDDSQHPQRLLYVPMTTATVRTTLPGKLLQFASREELMDRNTNCLFANLVVTSPSIDLCPRDLPLILALWHTRNQASSGYHRSRRFFSKFLPRTNLKLSVQEPVLRVALPTVEKSNPEDFDFDLLIFSNSQLSLDVEASHSPNEDVTYALTSELRVSSQKLYYQSASKNVQDIAINDQVLFKVQLSATPDVQVSASGSLQTIRFSLVKPEIAHGIQQIVKQIQSNAPPDKLWKPKVEREPNSLRTLPTWIRHVHLEGFNIVLDVAGQDERLSDQLRGVSFCMECVSLEYTCNKDELPRSPISRRPRASRSVSYGDSTYRTLSPPAKRTPARADGNGRRVALHVRGAEAFIIETIDSNEDEPCLSIPRAEFTLTSTNDGHGPTLHFKTLVKSINIQYSLFRHYCFAVASRMLIRTFDISLGSAKSTTASDRQNTPSKEPRSQTGFGASDFLAADARVSMIQIKAQMPSDPLMMFHIQDLEGTRHRYNNPLAKAFVLRLYAEAPNIPGSWNRITSAKNPRVDIRDTKRKLSNGNTINERSIDFASDAIRIGVPYQLIVHKIFDNIINTAKTVAQLHHRFETDSDEYILAKHPEGPKHVPKISVRTHMLLFELEDGAFEWKLGVIYRAGLVEQKQRLAREEAFRLKKRRLEGMDSSAPQTSTHSRSRSRHRSIFRSKSRHKHQDEDDKEEADSDHSSGDDRSHRSGRQPRMRYDKRGRCGFTQDTRRTIKDAEEKLKRYNAQSWKARIDRILKAQHGQVAELRSLLWGLDRMPNLTRDETILAMPPRPALLGLMISDVNLVIDKPSFPLEQCPDFLHRVGKGLPKDTQFTILVPMSVHLDMGEARATLRDYPLPLLHIPAIKPGQSPRLPSWSLRTDFVIAEEYQVPLSTRDFNITVIPPGKLDPKNTQKSFAIDVRRTVAPVKTYSDIQVDINTARDTRFTWGTSYQPAIQEMMQVLEGFTKPQADPSERLGFWDKIRLNFHSRINVQWKEGGDVFLLLKGSRSPYDVTGHAAGFALIWRNNIQWNIARDEDPLKFMTVESGDFVLAIPDYSSHARDSLESAKGQARGSAGPSTRLDYSLFKKVVMKLSGKVQWTAGLIFERNLPKGGRSFEFSPHYNVVLKNPASVKQEPNDPPYDAFRGFRSNHIHLSIGLSAPADRDWTKSGLPASSNYNAVHLTPRFFSHFFAWWDLFSGPMSLPVHQGPLFPQVEKSGKKFGQHLATIKYSITFSPLFLSHVYKHKEAEEFRQETDVVAATGLKLRLDSFIMDLHQRKEEFQSEVKDLNKVVTISRMKINQALLDLVNADLRAISSNIGGTSSEFIKTASPADLAKLQTGGKATELSAFLIPDNDFDWVDVDDLVEVDWTLPQSSDPKTQILPLAHAPQFTYRRQTDHSDSVSGDPHRHSPFGYESTHQCLMDSKSDSREVQIALIKERIKEIENYLEEHKRHLGEQELLVIRETEEKSAHESRLKSLQEQHLILEAKEQFLHQLLDSVILHLKKDEPIGLTDLPDVQRTFTHETEQSKSEIDNLVKNASMKDPISDFNNRFIVHNARIKWNNALRNIMLRYMHQVSQRRGFVYYTSRRAVKFILDIIEEQRNQRTPAANTSKASENGAETPQTPEEDDAIVQERIDQILKDGKDFVNADDPHSKPEEDEKATEKADQDVAQGFVVQNSFHVRLVAPQIQLQSNKNTKAAVLLTTRGIIMKVLQIMDRDRLMDDVSGLVQRRFSVDMDNAQFFVTQKQDFSDEYQHMYSNDRYGSSAVSSWPPWVPLEVMLDFEVGQYAAHGFSRVVSRTSAALRYDKYNKLRLKYNDDVTTSGESKAQNSGDLDNAMDHIWIDFPHLRALCDSNEYFSMFVIVQDLLLYSEPLEKARNERLEKILLASDFSDLRGAPEMVESLQERIRMLDEIKTHFHINEKFLDRQGWEDRIAMDEDLAGCEDELFFIMKAITTAQRKHDERADASQTAGVLKWHLSSNEIVWHLTQEANEPLAEFQLRNARYDRLDLTDGSNLSAIEIDRIHGLNLLPNAMYPEVLSAYRPNEAPEKRMLRINWRMLDAIAGIAVLDTFEVSLVPLKLQLEYETGRRLFEYVFPNKGVDSNPSPFMSRQKPQQVQNSDSEDSAEEQLRAQSLQQAEQSPAFGLNAPGGATGAGSLENRLTPTHRLPSIRPNSGVPPSSSEGDRPKSASGLGIKLSDYDPRRLFQRSPPKSTGTLTKTTLNKGNRSNDSLGANGNTYKANSTTSAQSGKKQRFAHFGSTTTRSSSADSRSKGGRRSDSRPRRSRRSSDLTTSSNAGVKKSDDLSQMLTRSSRYMTLAYVKMSSVELCLSYKGKGHRNVEDVHNLTFRMPTLEYRNKTWSNMDLVLALKRDVIRALLAHTGTIIGNKFSHHRPGKTQQGRLRELANESTLLNSRPDLSVEYGLRRLKEGLHSSNASSVFTASTPRMSDVTNEDSPSYPSSLGPTPEDHEDHYRSDEASSDANSNLDGVHEHEEGPEIKVADTDGKSAKFHDDDASSAHQSRRHMLLDSGRATLSKHLSELMPRSALARRGLSAHSGNSRNANGPTDSTEYLEETAREGSFVTADWREGSVGSGGNVGESMEEEGDKGPEGTPGPMVKRTSTLRRVLNKVGGVERRDF